MICPCCMNTLNEPELVEGQEGYRPPMEGDLAFCCHCGGALVITEDLSPKMVKEDYLNELIESSPNNQSAIDLFRKVIKECKESIYRPLFSNICKN